MLVVTKQTRVVYLRIGREAITALSRSKTEGLIYIHFSGQSHLSRIMDHLGCLARILRFLMTISWKPVNTVVVPGTPLNGFSELTC